MLERFPGKKSVTATAAALLAALGVAGVAIAQSGGTPPSKTPDTPAATSSEAPGTEAPDSATDKPDAQDANDAPDAKDANEAPDAKDANEAPDSPGDPADAPDTAAKK